MHFRWRGTLFRIHPITFIMAAMACFFGLSDDLLAVILSLSIHELAHLLAARWLNIMITSIDLLPFGGSARMQNPYSLSSLRLTGVALSGPMGNLALAIISAALGWAGWLSMYWASLLVQSNLILMFFNLLPALPLDGGRILYAFLTCFTGEKRALSIGIWLGRILAAAMLCCAGIAFFCGRKLNLTIVLTAIILFASGCTERSAQREAHAAALSDSFRVDPMPHRLTLVSVHEDCPVLDIAQTLRVGEEHLFAIFSKDRLLRFLSQAELLDFLAGQSGGEALRLPIKAAFTGGKKVLP